MLMNCFNRLINLIFLRYHRRRYRRLQRRRRNHRHQLNFVLRSITFINKPIIQWLLQRKPSRQSGRLLQRRYSMKINLDQLFTSQGARTHGKKVYDVFVPYRDRSPRATLAAS